MPTKLTYISTSETTADQLSNFFNQEEIEEFNSLTSKSEQSDMMQQRRDEIKITMVACTKEEQQLIRSRDPLTPDIVNKYLEKIKDKSAVNEYDKYEAEQKKIDELTKDDIPNGCWPYDKAYLLKIHKSIWRKILAFEHNGGKLPDNNGEYITLKVYEQACSDNKKISEGTYG
ncbi:MAG: hypothetical protein ABIG10_02820 [bacterium]